MATSDKIVQNPIVNVLTKAQYQGITTPSADEFYLITDDAAVSAGTGISVVSSGGETIVSLDSSYGLTTSDITTGTDTTNKLVSAKTIADVISGLGGGTVTDVQVGGTSIVTSGVANLVTNSTYNSSSNKIATMSDIPSVSDTKVKLTSVGSSSAEYPLILGPTSITSGNSYEANYNSSVTLDAYEQKLTLKKVKLVYDSNCYVTVDISGYNGDTTNNTPRVRLQSLKGNYGDTSNYNVRLENIATPSSNFDAANKKYVDDAVSAGDTKVTNTLGTTTKYYVTGTTSSSTNTGTQTFDSGIYATTTAGQLNATTYKVNEAVTLEYNSSTQSLDFIF